MTPTNETTPASGNTADTRDESRASSVPQRLKTFLLGTSRFHLVLIAVLVVTTIGFAAWRWSSISRLEAENARDRTRARAAMVAQSGELLQLSAVPLAWAIRAEILANDVGDIDAYMEKLVQTKYVKRIVLVDATGSVMASTNIKLKGQAAADALAGVDFAATAPRIEQAGPDLRMIVPVMSFERQIATLVLDYSATSIDSKLAE